MLNNLHQIEAEMKSFDVTYFQTDFLEDKTSIGCVNEETSKQKSSSKLQKAAIIGLKLLFALQWETSQ